MADPVIVRRHLAGTLRHLTLLLACAVMLGPFVWMVLTSLKTQPETVRIPPRILPETLHWQNYADVLRVLPFADFYLNTVVMTAVRTAGVLLLASMAGYAFARMRFRGRGPLFVVVLAVMMIPPQVLLIPQYQIMSGVGGLDSVKALIAPGLFSAIATFLLRQFFAAVPREIEEAALLDGAGPLRIYWRIMLPMVFPGLIAAGVLKTLWAWNELMWPLIVNTSPDKLPLSAGIALLKDENYTNFPMQMAGTTMAVLPMIVMLVLLQKYVVRGLSMAGGLK
jgi:multiple sugar transport system permease protein